MTVLRDPREVIREEPLMHRPILGALADGPLTVPEIAAAIGRPAEETLYWVMGMRRYGMLAEVGDADDDGYFRYEVKTGVGSTEPARSAAAGSAGGGAGQ